MTTYKPLENSDIDCIVLLMRDFYAIDNYPIDLAVSRQLFEEFAANESLGKAWLIYHNTEIVGYVILTFIFSFEFQGKIAFLDELYISENARGKGIGKQTINFIKVETLKLSLKLILLEVEPHNLNAQKLYISSDFEMHSRLMMKYKI
mgnify:CR=1 FL=1